MPIYEYQCTECGARTEALQRISDRPLETCDACGGSLRRLVSAPAFQFRGSGWYVTDYARKAGGSDKAEAGAAATPAKETSTEKEAKETPTAAGKEASSAVPAPA